MDLKEKVIFWNPRHHRRGPETNQGLMTAPPPPDRPGAGDRPRAFHTAAEGPERLAGVIPEGFLVSVCRHDSAWPSLRRHSGYQLGGRRSGDRARWTTWTTIEVSAPR